MRNNSNHLAWLTCCRGLGLGLLVALAFTTREVHAQKATEESEALLLGRCCLPNGGGCIETDAVTCANYCGSFGAAGSCTGPIFWVIKIPPPPLPPPGV